MLSYLQNTGYLGEILSLLTAVIWAVAVILFKKSGESLHPVALNLFKNLLGFFLVLLTVLLMGRTIFIEATPKEYLIVFLSGAIGIGLADTVFFKSLNILGAANVAIVGCIYSPAIILMSFLFLGEHITIMHIIGTSLILSAVILISGGGEMQGIGRKKLFEGIALSISSQILMAGGLVMAKGILDTRDLFWLTEMRFLGGLFVLFVMLIFMKSRREILVSLVKSKGMGYTISASVVGAYIALIVWLAGMKYTQVSKAAVLNQLSEIFIFILAAVFLHEKITLKKLFAIILAFCGAILVVMRFSV